MKFDFIIGNPPYNDEFGGTGDNKTYAAPVYNQFMDATYSLADVVELIHPARFLFNAGSTPKAWNEKMLADEHLQILHYVAESKDVFANTKIRGGLCVSYHDARRTYDPIRVFTPYPLMNSVTKKVLGSDGFESITPIMFIQNRFDLDALYKDYPEYKSLIGSDGKDRRFETGIFEKIPIFTEKKKNDDDIKVYGVIKKKRLFRYFPQKYTDMNHENIKSYKIVIMKSNGEGVFGETLASIDILEPYVAYTRSYIGIGSFDNEEDARRCKKYLKTKFLRAMLDVKKVTQDNPIDTWICVPMQDFSSTSDIDWSKSIKEVDAQLYAKYGLGEEEIGFIESQVKEMA